MEDKRYHCYIWFKVKLPPLEETKDIFKGLFASVYEEIAKSITIVGFTLPADKVEKHKNNIPSVLNIIYNSFIPTYQYTMDWILEIQKDMPFLRIVEGDRIFIRELNQCWECVKDGWVLVDTKGTTVS